MKDLLFIKSILYISNFINDWKFVNKIMNEMPIIGLKSYI